MAKNYLNSQSLHRFGKFHFSSSSDKAYIQSGSNSHKPLVKNVLHISKKSHSQKLPFRLRNFKTSPSPSSKRARRGSDASDRPLKQQKRSSEPEITGLEECGILAQPSPKRSCTIITVADEELYARRADVSKISSLNEDLITRRVKMAKYSQTIRQKKASVRMIRIDWSRMPLTAQRGMVNHTMHLCYRISLLQALLHMPIFVNWVLDYLLPEHCVSDNKEDCLSCCLRLLTQEYWSGARRPQELTKVLLGLDKLLKKLGWKPDSRNGHADPDEQALEIFKILRDELPNSIFSHFESFAQIVTSGVVACSKCGHQSRTKGNVDSNFSIALSPKIPKGSVSDYLKKYINETVEGYRCDGCKQISNVRKYQEISHAPEILVIQLKRFDHDRRKDNSAVAINNTLNLNQYREASNKSNLKYELKAVIKHAGTSDFGHYICSATGPDGKWYTFDDQKKTASTPFAATDGKSRFTPYILFFERQRKRQ